MSSAKPVPKDSLVISAMIKELGIQEYDPRVVNQLMEFVYKYVTSILEDAKVYSGHAKKKNIDIEDVKLAVSLHVEKSFTTPPPREILMEVARSRNNQPLPVVKSHCGLRLPADRFCLAACNYKLKMLKKSTATPQIGQPVAIKSSPAIRTSIQSRPLGSTPLRTVSGVVIRPPGPPKSGTQTFGVIGRPSPVPRAVVRLGNSAGQPQSVNLAELSVANEELVMEHRGVKREREELDYDG